MENKQYINAKFSSEFEKVNDDFLKCTVSLVTHEQIANGTRFMEKAIEEARYSLNYLPVIGWFKKNSNGEDDFSNHGIEYIIGDEGIEEVCHTVPFGVIIPNSSRYEMITADNGQAQKYLVADCYMWKRYDKAIKVLKENMCNQSVEIEIQDYNYTSECVEINKFNFTGVCVLSSDCQPAFNLAKIRTSDKFSKDDFKAVYSEMSMALDKFLNFEQGGEEMAKKRKCSKCEAEIEVDYEFDETEEFICDSCKEADFSKKEKFELSFDEIREKLRNSVKSENTYCWVVQTFSDYFIYEEETWNDNYEVKFYKQGYSLEGNDVKLEGDKIEVFARFITQEEINKLEEEKAEYENKIATLKADFTDLTSELEALKSDYSTLKTETEELRQYKTNIEFEQHKVEVDEVLAKYSELEAIDGYSELVKEKYTVDIKELEKAIKVFAFDNGAVLTKKNTKKNFNKENAKISIINKNRDGIKESAWDILDKYVTANK